ncbi:signal recognition particle 14 kDa protein-like [Garra rufa]|uniref:signal recognition particle 14 kDa protein-like n=1 Tax=Garra rufa TaxID=137080 RepID=UPI003CCE93AF
MTNTLIPTDSHLLRQAQNSYGNDSMTFLEESVCGGIAGIPGILKRRDDGRTKPVPRKGHPETFEPADNKCLLRASDGKTKISTVISTKEVIKFQMAYSNLLRAHMDGLKKKDKKSKSKKNKATQ